MTVRKDCVLLVLAAAIALAGCASTEQKIAQASEIKAADDPFKPYREYSTGAVTSGNMLGSGGKILMARVDRKTGAVTTLLHFQIVYNDGHVRQYETARNARAEQLPLRTLLRQGRCKLGGHCPYSDSFEVTLPEPDLRQAGADGYMIKVFARNGPEIMILVPKPMIASLLARVDADRTIAAARPTRG
jgi:hypothetical protein